MKNIFLIFMITLVIFLFIKLSFTFKDKNNLENDYSNISFYIKENNNRYKKYKELNHNKSIEQIITEVNIGIDNSFYTNTKEAIINSYYTLVNKYNYLNKEYVPNNLVKIDNTKLIDFVADSFNEMKKKLSEQNLNIVAVSGYRSYGYQDKLYKKYVLFDGRKKADTYSARAGYSEHQTGLAVDVSNGKTYYTDFENTEEFKWMEENAYKYGFILRYPKEKENITGYIYESWHYRYVGSTIATYIKKHNITFDEYYVKFIEPNIN